MFLSNMVYFLQSVKRKTGKGRDYSYLCLFFYLLDFS